MYIFSYLELYQFCFVWKEEGKVGGKDAVLHIAQHLLVLFRAELPDTVLDDLNLGDNHHDVPEDVVPLLLENAHGHVEVVVLHGRGGVDGSQWRSDVDHELVVEATMIQIMTQGSDEHGEHLQGPKCVST